MSREYCQLVTRSWLCHTMYFKEVVKVRGQDCYKEIKIIEFPNMIARVYIPDLTEEERKRRMKLIHEATASLLKVASGS